MCFFGLAEETNCADLDVRYLRDFKELLLVEAAGYRYTYSSEFSIRYLTNFDYKLWRS